MDVKPPRDHRLRELKSMYESAIARDFDPGISFAIDGVVVALEART